MQYSKFQKILILVVSLLPLCLAILFLIDDSSSLILNIFDVRRIPFSEKYPTIPFIIIPSMLILIFSLIIFYIKHSKKNSRIKNKNNWILNFVIGHVLVFPFYWKKYIWKDQEKNS